MLDPFLQPLQLVLEIRLFHLIDYRKPELFLYFSDSVLDPLGSCMGLLLAYWHDVSVVFRE